MSPRMRGSTADGYTVRRDPVRRFRQNTKFARLLKLMQRLQGRSRWNAKELASELECGERTVYRDIDVLALAGVPVYFDKAAKSYRVRSDWNFPVVQLTRDELLGQAVATAASKAQGFEPVIGARAATDKIAAVSGEHARQLLHDAAEFVSVLDLKWADHSRHRDIIRTIQMGLVERRQLAGDYASPHGSTRRQIRLHPYRLCLVKNAWYLIARPADEEQPKTFRVQRFKTLRITERTALIPPDFDLAAHFGNAWAVFRGDKTYDVEILFTSDSAPLATETVWHHTQRVRKRRDGSATVSFRVEGLHEIVWWFLSWAPYAQVISPPELRVLVAEQIEAAWKLNGTGKPLPNLEAQ